MEGESSPRSPTKSKSSPRKNRKKDKSSEYLDKHLVDPAIIRRCALPPYLDGTVIYSEQIGTLNAKLKFLDTIIALLQLCNVVIIFIELEIYD